jgi:hypothetical protein
MEITNLKLGITQKELIDKTKEHLEALYTQNETQNNDITTAQQKAEDAYLLASQKHKIVAYDTLSAMIIALNSANKKDFNIGDEIYIKDTAYTRDFWVSAKQDTKYTTQTDENGFKADTFDKGYVGYFELSILDSRPEVTNMVTSDKDLGDNQIVLGAGLKKIKTGSYYITQNDISNISSSTDIPVSSKVWKVVNDTKKEIENKLETAGKVKDVKVNGESVLDETTGIANIDLSDISVDVEELKTGIKQATLVPYPSDSDVQYQAIKMPKTSVVIEVLKKENNEYLSVVTQSIVVGEFTYYLLDKSATGDYWYREVGGNAVGGDDAESLSNKITELEKDINSLKSTNKKLYKYSAHLFCHKKDFVLSDTLWGCYVNVFISFLSNKNLPIQDYATLLLHNNAVVETNLSVQGYVQFHSEGIIVDHDIISPIVYAKINSSWDLGVSVLEPLTLQPKVFNWVFDSNDVEIKSSSVIEFSV